MASTKAEKLMAAAGVAAAAALLILNHLRERSAAAAAAAAVTEAEDSLRRSALENTVFVETDTPSDASGAAPAPSCCSSTSRTCSMLLRTL